MGSERQDNIMLGPVFRVTGLLPPQLQLTTPAWVTTPSHNLMFGVCLFIYYISVSGVTYDVVNSPPAFGVELDSRGHSRPVAIMQWALNQQYMIEGFTAGFMMLMSGVGFIIMDLITRASTTRMGYFLMLGLGMFCTIIGPFALYTFFRIKWPSYWDDMLQLHSRK